MKLKLPALEGPFIRPMGAAIQPAEPMVQRLLVYRAYEALCSPEDWVDQLAQAYVIAVATRSADAWHMQRLSDLFAQRFNLTCRDCARRSLPAEEIRRQLFPKLVSSDIQN
jgi:hypothetical protein